MQKFIGLCLSLGLCCEGWKFDVGNWMVEDVETLKVDALKLIGLHLDVGFLENQTLGAGNWMWQTWCWKLEVCFV